MSTKVTSCPSYIALKEVWEKAKGWKAQSLIGGITRVRPDSGDNIYQLPRVYKEPVFRSKEEYEAALSDMCMIARFNPKGFPNVDDVYKANETICTCGEHHRIYLPEDPMLFNYEIESEIAEHGAVYAGDVLIRLHPKGEPPPQEQEKWDDALADFRNALVKAFDNLPVETNSSFPKMSAAAKLFIDGAQQTSLWAVFEHPEQYVKWVMFWGEPSTDLIPLFIHASQGLNICLAHNSYQIPMIPDDGFSLWAAVGANVATPGFRIFLDFEDDSFFSFNDLVSEGGRTSLLGFLLAQCDHEIITAETYGRLSALAGVNSKQNLGSRESI